MIITVSRQLGSGGGMVGQIVAERLGIPYVDREILRQAAELAEVSEEAIQENDERRPSILERMSTFIMGYQAPLSPEYMPPDLVLSYSAPKSYRRLVEDVIRQMGESGRGVIVGRGAQVILREFEPALHVYVYAPLADRVRVVAERDRISRQLAAQRVAESDRNRAGYLRSYYGVEWKDPELYDLIINTGRIALEEAAELVVRAAATRGHVSREQPAHHPGPTGDSSS